MKRIVIYMSLVVLGVVAAFFIYQETCKVESIPAVDLKTPDTENPPHTETVVLTATGDCLMHNTQIWSGQQPDGSYNFDTFFAEVKDLINEGDYTSVCFEAPMAGSASGYTGYPLFNSPDEIADTFKEAGFDVVVTANNHIMDRGYKGAMRTMQVLEEAGLDYVGTYINQEAVNNFLIKDIKGVKVGYIAYTYSTNGIPVPEEHSYFVNFLDRDKILADINTLRPQVDVLVLLLHWGVEYSPQPTQQQRIMAREFLEAGADVILGSHPHVIQSMEIIKVENKDKFVIYSMGNFISHQRGAQRNSGIVLKIKFTKDFEKGTTLLDEVSYTPTFSHHYYVNGKMKFRVVPVQETIEKILAGSEPYLDQSYVPVLEAVLKSTTDRLGEPFVRQDA